MTFEQAKATLSKEEFDVWFQRYLKRILLRNNIIAGIVAYGFFGLWAAGCIWGVFSLTVGFMTDRDGPDAWPAGAFMSALIIYVTWMVFRYFTQEDETKNDSYSDYDDESAVYPSR